MGIFFLAVIAIAVFYLVYTLCAFLGSLVFTLFLKIPVLSTLLGWLFKARGDSPGLFVVFASAFIAFYISMAALEYISKSEDIRAKASKLAGSILLVANIVFLVLNIIWGNPVFPNVVIGVAGFAMRKV